MNPGPETGLNARKFGFKVGQNTVSTVNDNHLTEAARSKSRGQTRIARYASSNTQLFHYSDTNNREELTPMIVIEHLPLILVSKLILLIIVNKH